jgi:hypothetical protein
MPQYTPQDSPIMEEARATAERLGVRLAPEVLDYLQSKVTRGYGLVAVPDEQEAELRKNTALLIYEASAASRATERATPAAQIDLASVNQALNGLCARFPDFWPFCKTKDTGTTPPASAAY